MGGIAFVLGGVALLCALIWCATWAIPLLIALVVMIAYGLFYAAMAVLCVLGSIPWAIWWLFDRDGAMAAVSGVAPRSRRPTYVRESTDLGPNPFRRRGRDDA